MSISVISRLRARTIAKPRGGCASSQHCGLCSRRICNRTSNLLEPLAVSLIDAHKAADEVYVFLVGKGTVPGRPGQIPRRFGMVWIVNEIMFGLASCTTWFSGVKQHRVINAQSRISGKITDEQVAAR